MKRIEYEEVIKSFDIPISVSDEFMVNYKLEKVYFWNDLVIYYTSYYAVVKGKIPFVLAKTIWDNYPNRTYQIRVNGGSDLNQPKDFAVDEQFEREIATYVEELEFKKDPKDYFLKCDDALDRMRRRNKFNKYVTCYHIDTKEGLNAFLKEYIEYINSLKEQQKEDIINEVVKALHKKL